MVATKYILHILVVSSYHCFHKIYMSNLLYLIAVILIILWAVGRFGYGNNDIIHILLGIAIVAVLLRIIQGRQII